MRAFERLPRRPFVVDGTTAAASVGVALVSGLVVPGEGWIWIALLMAGVLVAWTSVTTARLYRKVRSFVEEARHEARRRPVRLMIHEQMTEAMRTSAVPWLVVIWSAGQPILRVEGHGFRPDLAASLDPLELDERSLAFFAPYPRGSQGNIHAYDPTSDEVDWKMWVLLARVDDQQGWQLELTDRVNTAMDSRLRVQAKDLAAYFQGYFSRADL